MRLQGLLVVRLPASFVPHSASLGPATATQVLSAPPTCLDECLFFISLVSGFLAVRFSVSSGCAKRRSVSTYAAILVLYVYAFKWSTASATWEQGMGDKCWGAGGWGMEFGGVTCVFVFAANSWHEGL